MRKRKSRQKIFCIGFAFCLWISGFTMVSADNASGMDKYSGSVVKTKI